jgi:hypothetical protein
MISRFEKYDGKWDLQVLSALEYVLRVIKVTWKITAKGTREPRISYMGHRRCQWNEKMNRMKKTIKKEM